MNEVCGYRKPWHGTQPEYLFPPYRSTVKRAAVRPRGGSVPRHTPGSSFSIPMEGCKHREILPPGSRHLTSHGVRCLVSLDTWNEDTRSARQAAVMPRCSRICVTRPQVPGNSIKPAARTSARRIGSSLAVYAALIAMTRRARRLLYFTSALVEVA